MNLLEGLSAILYHVTSVERMASILENNKFELTTDMGSRYERSKRPKDTHSFYMSFARSAQGEYDKARDSTDSQCMIVLDGKKLMASGYSGKPIDYWNTKGSEHSKFEMEDRIYSDKNSIPNASKYIKEIHILVNVDELQKDEKMLDYNKKHIRTIKKQSILKNIPSYIYTDYKKYLTLRKNNAKIDLKLSGNNKDDSYQGWSNKHFLFHVELLRKNNEKNLSKPARDILYKYQRYSWNIQDMVMSLEADIHNTKKNTGIGRTNLNKFLQALRDNKIYNLSDYINFIIDKYKK
jgi:hypothetical protein